MVRISRTSSRHDASERRQTGYSRECGNSIVRQRIVLAVHLRTSGHAILHVRTEAHGSMNTTFLWHECTDTCWNPWIHYLNWKGDTRHCNAFKLAEKLT